MKKAFIINLFILAIPLGLCYAQHSESTDTVSSKKVLFMYPSDDSSDEYTEGEICIYDLERDTSYSIIDGIMVDHSEAWLLSDGNVLLFSLQGIYVLDQEGGILNQRIFAENELVIGAAYQPDSGKVVFLLSRNRQTDLLSYDIISKDILLLKEQVPISTKGIEEPFKEMFFISDAEVFINDSCTSSVIFNIVSSALTNLPNDRNNCFGYGICQNKDKMIQYSYTDEGRQSYVVESFSFKEMNFTKVVSAENAQDRYVAIRLYCSYRTNAFVLGVDDIFYLHNDAPPSKLNIKGLKEVLAFTGEYVIYTTHDDKLASQKIL